MKYAIKFLAPFNMQTLFSEESRMYCGGKLVFGPLRGKFQLALDLIIRFVIEFEREKALTTNINPICVLTSATYASAHGLTSEQMKHNYFPILMMMFDRFLSTAGSTATKEKRWVSADFVKNDADEFLTARLQELEARTADYMATFHYSVAVPRELNYFQGIGTPPPKSKLN